MSIQGLRGAALAAACLMAATLPGCAADEGYRLSQSCAACHGTDGASPSATVPILGGQNGVYLAEAMRAYKRGERDHDQMKAIAEGFTDAQIDAMGAWFESRPWVNTPVPHDPAKARDAETLAEGLCATCHGPDGKGTGAGPRLAGQPADYLALALHDYKDGTRASHTARVASTLLDNLSDEEIAATSNYYAGLR
jgi:sulfide dehydrogenase cytochrome subunit